MAKKKQRGTPTRRKKSPKKSTALVQQPKAEVIDAHVIPDARTIGDGIVLGELGLVEVRLSQEEERALSEPVPIESVKILPTGQVYAPHTEYTKLFNRAFGRLGWSIVPVGKPALAQRTVICPYILYIHGKPVAFAQGEQEFHDNNKGQSYGDANESTVASALRRTAKRIGVWLELWDRRWSDAFVATQGVKVWCEFERDGKKETKPQWRLKTDPPFWNEKGKRGADREPGPVQRDAPAGFNPDDNKPITLEQRERLMRAAQRAGRPATEVAMWLKMKFKIDSSKDLKRRDYEYVVKAIEHPGDLPGVRED